MTTSNTLEVIREDSNMPTTTCPSREIYLQYSRGLVSEEELTYLAEHLDSCPDCQDVVMTLDDADDTVVGRLRMPLSGESFLAEPQLQRALAAAIAMPIPRPDAEGGPNVEDASVSDMPETLGEYQLLEELGRGGMGRVYKALQTKLDRVVALKVLPRGRVGDRQAINRFEREMKAVGRLAHPNIVQAYDAREIDDMPVLIMEFVHGLDLADIVRRVGTVPVAEACELVRRTALALQCAHEHGLVHRDIKPSNIMLTPGGEVKLLDLGLARVYAEGGASVPSASSGEEMTGTGQAMGTADYMAPEQASDSRTVDIRADIYSLGCTLYKLLSGRAPFSGPEYRSTLDKLNAHVHQPVPTIRNFVPEVPEELAAILDRMLAKDPNERFATPAEVAAALEPFCQGANLAGLTAQAMAIDIHASQQEIGSEIPFSQRERASEDPLALRERARVGTASPTLRRPILWRILIGLGFLGALAAGFAAGIIIMIKRDDKETKIRVPDGSDTLVTADGQLEVTLPGQTKSAEQASKPKESTVPDEKAIQGTWEVVSSTFHLLEVLPGEEDVAREQVLKTTKVIITADMIKILGSHVTNMAFDYKLRPAANRNMIDLESRQGVSWGIYQLTGSELKICTLGVSHRPRESQRQRPSEFWAELGSGKELLVLRRVGEASVSADEKAILGKWRVERLVFPENNLIVSGFSDLDQRVVFSPRTMRFVGKQGRRGGGPDFMEDRGYALNPTDQPKRIDFVGVMIRTTHAVYEFRGDQLTLVYPWFPARGDVRPSKLAAGPDTAMVVLKRVVETTEKLPVHEDATANPPVESPSINPAAKLKAIQSGAATPFAFRTTTVTRGDITATVGASGTVEPEEVVDVGAQVTGMVISLGAELGGKTIDFGSPVAQNTVLAQIDDTLYRVRADQQLAALARAKAELAAAQAKAKGETSEAAKAAVVAAEAAVAQAEAARKEAEINLAMTTVRSPVRGVIVDRRVNVGQNVGPAPNSAGLFLIAKSLEKMLVWASVNEADIGRIQKGMEAHFTVDAFPKDVFKGTVTQIRLNATLTQNVVIYTVVVDIEKPDRKLLPYMTANLTFQVAKKENVLRVANAALRWKPTPDQMAPGVHPATGSHDTLWKIDSDRKHVRPVDIQIGLTDETRSMTEVSGPDVKEGMEVVVGTEVDGVIDSDPFLPKLFKNKPLSASATGENHVQATPLTPVPPAVRVSQPVVRDVSDYLDLTGRTGVAKTAEIRARVTGELLKVHVKPGMSVKQGELLMEIDPRLYRAELDQSSNLVKQAKIRLDARTLELKRAQALLSTHAITQAEGDQAMSQRAEAEAALQTAEAALEVARLRLEYTRIVAPFAGVTSGPVLDEGNLATADKTALATIASTDPLCLDFQMDESSLLAIRRKGNGKSDPLLSLPVLCGAAGDKGYPYRAKMDFVDGHVNPATGTISCRAMLANKDGVLMPGMFVRVRLITSPPHKALLVPDRAIGSDQGQKFVFIVTDQNTVQRRAIETGNQDDGMRVVEKGLTADDWVIEKGLLTLRGEQLENGTTVKPLKPSAAVPPSSSQDNLPSASSAAELKVYGGKALDQWRDLARTDLDNATRVKAFQALGAFASSGKSTEALTAILEALKVDQSPDALKAAYTALRLTGPQGEATIISGIRHKDPVHRRAAIEGWLWYGSRDTYAVPALIEAVDDTDPLVRREVCLDLANIAVATEYERKKDGSTIRIRPEGEIGPTTKVVVPALCKRLKDADSGVRLQAVDSLRNMGMLAKAAIPDLIAFVEAASSKLKAAPPTSREYTYLELCSGVEALGRMGPAASAAVPLLTMLQQAVIQRTNGREVARVPLPHQVKQALDRIQGKPKPQIKPDSVHPDAAQPGQNPPPQMKGGRESVEK